MAGRARTCCAPRFRRPLYPLSYSHAMTVGCIVATVAATDMRGRGSQRLAASRRTDRSRHGFGAAEAGLRSGVPGQGLEPRPPRSERGVLPVRRSRNAPCPPSTPDLRGRRSGTAEPVFALSYGTEGWRRPMFSMPLAYPSTLDRRQRRPTWRSIGARRSCGFRKMRRQKQN